MKIPENLPVINFPSEAMNTIINDITTTQFKPFGKTRAETKIAIIENIGSHFIELPFEFDIIVTSPLEILFIYLSLKV